MTGDHVGRAVQAVSGDSRPRDEARLAVDAGWPEAEGLVVEMVDEPGEVLGTIVSDDSSPTFEEIRFRLSSLVVVSPGEFVAAEARDRAGSLVSWVLCRVLDVHE